VLARYALPLEKPLAVTQRRPLPRHCHANQSFPIARETSNSRLLKI
jgi:hypothetical protein